jgi:UDP-glucose 4-epimerase
MNVLVTGGAGYIGSHTVLELLTSGYTVTVVDSLVNSSAESLQRVEKLTGKKVAFYELDIQDAAELDALLDRESFDAIIHFAAFKAVGESVSNPLKYYQNNVAGFISLLKSAQKHTIQKIVFSSTAAVYGTPPVERVTETTSLNPESPYGSSKYMDEIILRDCCNMQPELQGVALRYFNVVGAHESGELGESPVGTPQNLLPILIQSLTGKVPPLVINGDDYPTTDGTCERDYVHVVDLAKAHVAALKKLDQKLDKNYHVYNIGTGKPTSVLKLIQIFEAENGVKVPYSIGPRRAGDPAAFFASPDKANTELGWQSTKTIEDAVRDSWNWQSKYPDGYTTQKEIKS